MTFDRKIKRCFHGARFKSTQQPELIRWSVRSAIPEGS
jgi:hypothetical protein